MKLKLLLFSLMFYLNFLSICAQEAFIPKLFNAEIGVINGNEATLDFNNDELKKFALKWIPQILRNEMTETPSLESFSIEKNEKNIWFLTAKGQMGEKYFTYRTSLIRQNQNLILTEGKTMEICICDSCEKITFESFVCGCENNSETCEHRFFIATHN